MPFLFIVAGLVLTIAAGRGTQDDLISLLKTDFTGKNNFVYWLFSILIIGAVGYIDALRPVSRAFMVLVIIVLFLKNGGVFSQFTSAIGGTQTASTTKAKSSATTTTPSSTAQGNDLTDSLDNALQNLGLESN